MPRTARSESILQHLPDVSDASLTIPAAGIWDDLLLTNDDDDFFRDMEDSISIQISSRTEHEPLTLSQLTPKPKPKPESASTLQPPSNKPSEPQIKADKRKQPIPASQTQISAKQKKVKPRPIAAVVDATVEKFESRKGEPATLGDIPGTIRGTPKRHLEGIQPILNTQTISRRGVTNDGASRVPEEESRVPVAKGRDLISASQRNRSAETKITSGQSGVTVTVTTQPGPSSQAISGDPIVLGGKVERLPIYSEALDNPFRSGEAAQPEVPEFQNRHGSPITAQSAERPSHLGKIEIAPLSLSDIPPLKVVAENSVALTMRQPGKRSAIESSTSEPPHKKGKRNDALSSAVVLLPSQKKNVDVAACRSNSASDHVKGKTKLGRAPRQILGSVKGKTADRDRTANVARSLLSSSRSTDDTASESVGREKIPSRQGNLSGSTRNSNTKVAYPSLTRPVEFNFRLDARREARKGESESGEKARSTGRRQPYHPAIPDFKALHAAQEVERVLRKEQITPILPVPIELKTDARAKARHEFDEMMREKERTIEKALAERKKDLEAEEEREVREIRRRAIPKAHEVPEWYRDAPRRK